MSIKNQQDCVNVNTLKSDDLNAIYIYILVTILVNGISQYRTESIIFSKDRFDNKKYFSQWLIKTGTSPHSITSEFQTTRKNKIHGGHFTIQARTVFLVCLSSILILKHSISHGSNDWKNLRFIPVEKLQLKN